MRNDKSKSPTQPVSAGAGSTREQILEVAERMFARYGFAGASLDIIAEQVGIRRPSLLHHFRSKRDLYDEVERQIFNQLIAELRFDATVVGAFDRLLLLLRGWLSFMISRPNAARMILRNASDLVGRSQDPIEFSSSAVGAFEQIIRAGVASGEFRPIDPMLALNLLGSPILSFVCNTDQFGADRIYDIHDPITREAFERALERSAAALLSTAG